MDSRIEKSQRSPTGASKPNGLKTCGKCKENCGLRTLKCKRCGAPFKRKCRDWDSIALHASTMKDSYIKEKLYDRMDQLSTKPGWTGVLFLVHDSHKKSKPGRVFTHSYATRGDGQKIEAALKESLFKTMKSYLFGSNTEITCKNGLTKPVITKNIVDDAIGQKLSSSSSKAPGSPQEILEISYNCVSSPPSMSVTTLNSIDNQMSDHRSSSSSLSASPCSSSTYSNGQITSAETLSVEVVALSSLSLPSSFEGSCLPGNPENAVIIEHKER